MGRPKHPPARLIEAHGDLLDTVAAAQYLGVTVTTMHHWSARTRPGIVRPMPVRSMGKLWWPRTALDAFIAESGLP